MRNNGQLSHENPPGLNSEGMKFVKYRDPSLQLAKEKFELLIANDGVETARETADRLRHSDSRLERQQSAVGYLEVAESLHGENPLTATYCYHYSGQGFRLEGLTSKAARSYEISFDTGLDVARKYFHDGDAQRACQLQKFNARSIGRAVICYRDAGQDREKVRCQRKKGISEQERFLFEGNRIGRFGSLIWQMTLDYSLSWSRAAILSLVLMLVSVFLPLVPAVVVLGVALSVIWFVFARRVLD
jgi:hypothetical protein